MTRENKLALIIGFALVLVVGILVSDHFSAAAVQGSADLLVDEENGAGTTRVAGDAFTPVPVNGRSQGSDGIRLIPQPSASNGTHLDHHDDSQPRYLDNPDLQAVRPQEEPPMTTVGGEQGYTWYVVKAGESLSKICEREYGDMNLWPRLVAHNADRISDPNSVPQGVTIRIPSLEVLLGAAASAPASQPAADRPADTPAQARPPAPPASEQPQQKYITYTIKAGDSLTTIAQKHLGSARRYLELYNLNKDVIANPDRVIEGTKIRIPKES